MSGNHEELEKLRDYVRRTLLKSSDYRIQWPEDLLLADMRNTPLLLRESKKDPVQ